MDKRLRSHLAKNTGRRFDIAFSSVPSSDPVLKEVLPVA